METKDYIDTVVLIEDSKAAGATGKSPAGGRREIAVVNDVRLTRVGDLKVSSLSIDESYSEGGDPYNNTGKHCVLNPSQK
jgi:hypothetical protein